MIDRHALIQKLFRLIDPSLYDSLQPYRVKNDALMPEEYQAGRRPLHDDWAILSWVRRIDCAYRVPLPFRIESGAMTKAWLLFEPGYPISPGAETMIDPFDGQLYVLTDRGGYGLVVYSAFIGGQWRKVFRKYTRAFTIFGTRYRLSWYAGLHQDNHVSPPDPKTGRIRSDLMAWFPEFAMSFVKEI